MQRLPVSRSKGWHVPSLDTLTLFLGAAVVLAALPGPGLFYIAGRTLASGRTDGLASCMGSALGGLVHVLAGAVGVSALLMASASAFTVLKTIGGLYLIYLGVQTWRTAGSGITAVGSASAPASARTIRQGFIVEATNPKTAAFFLALIPQFIAPSQGSVAFQFVILGLISVVLNTAMALLVVWLAIVLRERLTRRTGLLKRLRQGSGAVLAGLGVSLLLTRRPA
jgi:threonine/homoserine/homoserine lactone efflux protein